MMARAFNLAVQSPESDLPEPVFNLLVLIATTVLADGHSSKRDSQTFTAEVRRLNLHRKLGAQMSEARLLLWYELHKDMILHKIRTADFKVWFYDILESFNTVPEKKHILNAMQRIADTGKHVNINGYALFSLTKRYWKV